MVGAFAVLFLTRRGVNVSVDSASYIGAARNLRAGLGLTVPWSTPPNEALTHFPPLYPSILAFLSLTGASPLAVARWLNVLLLVGSVFLVGFALHRMLDDRLIALLGALSVAVSPAVLTAHAFVWSEPPFIFLVLVALTALWLYARTSHLGWLLTAAAFSGLAILCRWAGAPLFVTGLIIALVFSPADAWRRVWHTCLFGAVTCLPVLGWVARNSLIGGSMANRQMVWHPVGVQHFSDLVLRIPGMFSPLLWQSVRIRYLLAFFALFAFGGISLTVWSFAGRSARRRWAMLRAAPWPFAIFAAGYVSFLLLSISLFDRSIPLDNRMLLPVYPLLIILLLWLWKPAFTDRGRPSWLSFSAVGLWSLAVVLQIAAGGNLLLSNASGMGLSHPEWAQSEMVRQINALPPDRILYADHPQIVYLLTGRHARGVPGRIGPTSGRAAPGYEDRLREIGRELRRRGGVLLLVRFNEEQRWPLPEQLREVLHVTPFEQTGKGDFYVPSPE